MNNRQREHATLSFGKKPDRGAIEETFHPWTLTVAEWKSQGLPEKVADSVYSSKGRCGGGADSYLYSAMAEGVYNFEKHLGLDSLIRFQFILPFRNFVVRIVEETTEYTIRQEFNGWLKKHCQAEKPDK